MQYQWSMLTSNRNQPLEFQGKSLNWFLHEGNIVCKWVNLKFKAQFCYSSCWFWTYSTILYQWFGLTQKYVTQNYWTLTYCNLFIHTRTCAYQVVTVSWYPKRFVHVIFEWSLSLSPLFHCFPLFPKSYHIILENIKTKGKMNLR